MRKLVVLGAGRAWWPSSSTAPSAWGTASPPSTLLLAGGLGPAAASAAVHFSEIGTSLVSGVSHHTLGNTDWRTVGILAVPGFVGAFAGATFLVSLDADAAVPVVAVLLLVLGGYVTWRFLTRAARPAVPAAGPSARFLVPMGLVGRGPRRGRRRRLGAGGHHLAAVLRSSRAAQGRRLGRHRRVRGRRSAARSASWSRSAARASTGRYVAALLVGGVRRRADRRAGRPLPRRPRVLGVSAGGLIVLTNLQDAGRLARTPPASPSGCSPRWCSRSGCCGSPGP